MMRRLWGYSDKVFSLPERIGALANNGFSRRYGEPLLVTILLTGMFLRLRSFNALELSLRNNRAWRRLANAARLPSADTLARGVEKSDVDGFRAIMRHVNHRLRRNKTLGDGSASYGLMAAAVDGCETFSSEKRCCAKCLTRKKNVKGEEVIEYYHRYVFCQLILRPIPSIFDIEPLLPGEGETAAAKRLIRRMLQQQPRMVEVFSFDALYADGSLLRSLGEAGKYWVVVLKDENRDAYAEIDRRLPKTAPQVFHTGKSEATLWDMQGLVGWDTLATPFRAVVSEEKKWAWRLNPERKREKVLETSHWRWLTNLPEIYPAAAVHRFGHGRWDIENRCFNELTNACHMSHPFHHHPNALLAMLWLICLAFIISYAFFMRNLKPHLRARISTRTHLVERLLTSFTPHMQSLHLLHPT